MKAILSALLSSGESTSWLATMMNIILYPFVIPAILVGVYLRVLRQRGEEQARGRGRGHQNTSRAPERKQPALGCCSLGPVLRG